jgi:hypothetical protein
MTDPTDIERRIRKAQMFIWSNLQEIESALKDLSTINLRQSITIGNAWAHVQDGAKDLDEAIKCVFGPKVP